MTAAVGAVIGKVTWTERIAVATDLHILLDRGHVPGPFVLVGHSSGAQYVRIFAGRYPEQVAGMVLLDGQPAEAFEGLPSFPAFYSVFRRVFALLPSLARLGVGRLVYRADAGAAMQRLTTGARPQPARRVRRVTDVAAQARSFQSLGDRPLVVVTAAVDALAGWLPLQDEMATLSTNSSHRVVPYTHDALITDQTAAQTSSQAIRDVMILQRCGSAGNSWMNEVEAYFWKIGRAARPDAATPGCGQRYQGPTRRQG